MTEGWYDAPDTTGYFDRATFNEDYVPPSWRHDSTDNVPPPGTEQLFLEVVQPICFVCHSRRGTTLGTDDTLNNNDPERWWDLPWASSDYGDWGYKE